ncbi:MAG: exonuclease V subunit alpha, partial [Sphingomonas sp.]
TAYRVDAIDPSANTLRLLDPANQAITWNPAQGGADQAEAYAEVRQEFRTGDRIQFTRNNHAAKRVNGRTAEVVAIDPDEGLLVVRNKTGKRQTLDMANVVDRHIRPGWVQTIHAAQGATSDRVMVHLESFRSNVDARIAYVAVSRAKTHATIYTDDRVALVDAIEGRDGGQVGAIDETLLRGKAAIASPVPVSAAGMAIG